MNKRAHMALRKLAQDQDILTATGNWAGSLFDGKQGTSQPAFKTLVNTPEIKKINDSWSAFKDSGSNFLGSLADGKQGTSWDAFKNMYTGKGAPFAWGATGAMMATAFNSLGNNRNGNRGGFGGSLGILPMLALGGAAYWAYKNLPKWVKTYNNLTTLKNGTTDQKQEILKNLSVSPSDRSRSVQAAETFGSKDQAKALAVNTNVSPVIQMNDNYTVTQLGLPWYKRPFFSNVGVTKSTNHSIVYNSASNINTELNNKGWGGENINGAGQLDYDTLKNFDSKNIDERGMRELKLLGQLKLTPAAYQARYRDIVSRWRARAADPSKLKKQYPITGTGSGSTWLSRRNADPVDNAPLYHTGRPQTQESLERTNGAFNGDPTMGMFNNTGGF